MSTRRAVEEKTDALQQSIGRWIMPPKSAPNHSSVSPSRREFLQSLATAGATLPLLPKIFVTSAEAQAAESKNYPINIMHPAFSRAERDRRWAAVRHGMAKPQW